MIQENGHSGFDRKIQNLLADAVEPVPESAWEGIAARLAAAGAASADGAANAGAKGAAAMGEKGKGRIIRWAGVSIAAAAAALALLLTPWSQPQSPSEDAPDLAVVTEVPQTGETATTVAVAPPANGTGPAAMSKTGPATMSETGPAAPAARARESVAVAKAPETSEAVAVVTETPQKREEMTVATETPQTSETTTAAAASPQDSKLLAEIPDWGEEIPSGNRNAGKSGFNIAGYSNALSNFTSKKNGQYTGYSGATDSSLPNHSYVQETGEVNYSIPISAGINVTYDITPRWSVGIGINYTRLSRNFSGTYFEWNGEQFDGGTAYDNIFNIQQFIGVPVTAYFHILRSDRIDFYVHAGGTVEKCLANTWTANKRQLNHNEAVNGAQLSVGAGLGVDFVLSPLVSIYLDPDIKYYFRLNQPKSIRTKQPLMLGFELGVRFHL